MRSSLFAVLVALMACGSQGEAGPTGGQGPEGPQGPPGPPASVEGGACTSPGGIASTLVTSVQPDGTVQITCGPPSELYRYVRWNPAP